MTVNQSRSQKASMLYGSTDGKYRKRRPDTEVAVGLGDQLVETNRDSLNPFNGYDYVNSEAIRMVGPGSLR